MATNLLLRSALAVGLGALSGGTAAFSPEPTAASDPAEGDDHRLADKTQAIRVYEWLLDPQCIESTRPMFAPNFIEHDPAIENGVNGVIKYYKQLTATYPQYSYEIRRATSSAGLVILHVLERRNPWDRGDVRIHMYRMSIRGITEHWVVGNKIPATSLNANGLI